MYIQWKTVPSGRSIIEEGTTASVDVQSAAPAYHSGQQNATIAKPVDLTLENTAPQSAMLQWGKVKQQGGNSCTLFFSQQASGSVSQIPIYERI